MYRRGSNAEIYPEAHFVHDTGADRHFGAGVLYFAAGPRRCDPPDLGRGSVGGGCGAAARGAGPQRPGACAVSALYGQAGPGRLWHLVYDQYAGVGRAGGPLPLHLQAGGCGGCGVHRAGHPAGHSGGSEAEHPVRSSEHGGLAGGHLDAGLLAGFGLGDAVFAQAGLVPGAGR